MTASFENSVACLGGAGGMGETLARHLCQSDQVAKLIIADIDADAAARLAGELAGAATCEVTATGIDILDGPRLEELLAGVDLVANAAGPFFRLGLPTLQAAIATRTPYLDICDDPEPTVEMMALDADAKAAGVGAVIGMGASPGISNLLARRAADCLDEVSDCYTVWPLDVEMPGQGEPPMKSGAGAEVSAAIVHLMEQISGTVESVVSGRRVKLPPLESIRLDYPGLGEGTALTVGHPEPVTLHKSLAIQGRSANAMLVQPSTARFLKSLARDINSGKLTLEQAAQQVIHPGSIRGVLSAALSFLEKGPGQLPFFFVLLTGVKDGVRKAVGCQATTLPPGMDAVTSIPAAIALEMLLRKPAPPGIHAPENVIDANDFLDRLRPYCPGNPGSVDELAPVDQMELPQ